MVLFESSQVGGSIKLVIPTAFAIGGVGTVPCEGIACSVINVNTWAVLIPGSFLPGHPRKRTQFGWEEPVQLASLHISCT